MAGNRRSLSSSVSRAAVDALAHAAAPISLIVADQRLVGDQRGEMDMTSGSAAGSGAKRSRKRRQVGQLACREIGGQQRGEVGLAAALMGQGQQVDHQAAGRFFREPFEQPVEGLPVGVAREELVAVDEVQQRHRLAPQGVDHMAIIDDMRVLARGIGAVRAPGSSAACRR